MGTHPDSLFLHIKMDIDKIVQLQSMMPLYQNREKHILYYISARYKK